MSTFSIDECLAYDGPHCDCFTSRGESCCYCREVPPEDDEPEGDS